MKKIRYLTVASLLLVGLAVNAADKHPGQDKLVDEIVASGKYTREEVETILGRAVYQQKILDIYKRTAESNPWYTYKPIFITEQRLREGLAFWKKHRQAIARAAENSAVDEEIIVAIIGVETYYGRILGNYRVLDALMTLAFYHPTRKAFFSRELKEYLLLSKEEDLPLYEIRGSYAGAMGLGQFMPSSYRAYAVDQDGDQRRDLWGSVDDAIASVANYFRAHRWRKGETIAVPVERQPGSEELKTVHGKPASTVGEYAEKGYPVSVALPADTPANLVVLQLEEGNEYWLGLHNFYVITRYNRSPMYAMVVKILSEQLRAGMDES